MVMLEAEHTCMTMRGIKKPGSKTITTVTRGAFKEDKELQKIFLSMVKDDASFIDKSILYLAASPLSKHLKKIQELENDRDFLQSYTGTFSGCWQALMYIYSLEKQCLICPRELIYALLFFMISAVRSNICRVFPHDIAGAEIRRKILADLHFTEQEKEDIICDQSAQDGWI